MTELNIRRHLRALMDAAANCWDPDELKRLHAEIKRYRAMLQRPE
jgi:hypothetical protein